MLLKLDEWSILTIYSALIDFFLTFKAIISLTFAAKLASDTMAYCTMVVDHEYSA